MAKGIWRNTYRSSLDSLQKSFSLERALLSSDVDSLLSGNKKLQEKLIPFQEFLKIKYPGLDEQGAFNKMKMEIEQLRNKVEYDKNTIRSLSASVELILSDRWRKSPVGREMIAYIGEKPQILAMIDDHDVEPKIIVFTPETTHRYDSLDEKHIYYRANLNVQDGKYPLGENIIHLLKYNSIQIEILLGMVPKEALGEYINIEHIDVRFSINNKNCEPVINIPIPINVFKIDKNQRVSYRFSQWDLYKKFETALK
jgi:hypothetical protein